MLHVANQSKTSLDSIQPDQKKQSWPIVYFLLGAFNVLSVGAGLYPALRAARMTTVLALKSE